MQEQLAFVVKKLKRNKAYSDTIGGLHIIALDGSEYFRSESIHCDECLEYHIITHYGFARLLREPLHRAVIAQKVGCGLKPIMAVEKILPKDKRSDNTAGHEGELTAAKRLARKVIGSRFVSVFTTDALDKLLIYRAKTTSTISPIF